jgi:transposase
MIDETDLTPDRAHAIKVIVEGAELSEAAEVAGVDRETVRAWVYRDNEFIASMNQAKRERSDQLRAEVLSLASDAVKVIRELVRGGDVPPATRLKACCIILAAADALKPEPIGPTSTAGVRSRLSHRDLLESLGG